MSKTFTVISGSDERPNWLEMRPAHFDVTKLPPKHRKADPDALWTVPDLMTTAPKTPKVHEMDGQADLFSETGQ